MGGTRTSGDRRSPGARGRIDKRQAILDAAFTVFAREGYAQAGVDVIAAEAGVAKATVYNHFRDKENLLREAVAASADQAMAENMAVVGRLSTEDGDLRARMEDVGLRLLRCYCDERSWALRRLLSGEINQFPDLLDIVHGHAVDRVTEALADRMARLTVAGALRARDPLVAAEQFVALLTGPAETRSRLGTREVPDAELRAVARAAVDTFLQAFGAETTDR
ncbi:transcriptional regulator, TetR family [Streptoalloteichus tenebrarius]|uniref:Transcriptional regulator, TetR family n=1 Tax=Streptoalloteichus tenebrarius (strain ATCC 17920 / DSM 40477 / JCM 4838 / CBS 697.72 / NBRC 16177 / NCIMB 11028 / NRRL B-12390 / A12253. 1 / ISP 5477) TaxID=1933 RepID=A0ABT1HM16_STRSD|nr:TetR/AcrR family transcriptional regulator [Streptoalloteichus tenebrarius]MCP2256545.1 transcriptional regulator, TetR family [Streptoalloteichus tenebrarius]BFF04900.1 TetR/AcrR family transcriptional regulator [Streptoalloteichus tenebrarius]